MFKQKALLVAIAGVALVILGYATVVASAQGPATPPAPDGAATAPALPPVGPGGRGNQPAITADMQGLMEVNACSATDNTDVVAKALGMTATDLRVALVSGKTIQDLATAKNVTLDTLRTALTTAQKAQVAQAVKDGVITQAQADFITGLLDRVPATSTAAGAAPQAQGTAQAPNPGANGSNNRGNNALRPRGAFPGGMFAAGRGFGAGISPYVTVNNNVVASKAINISCAALLVAVNQGHQSIAQVAQAHNVTAQTVIDALVKAHTDALNEDVKEGLYTTAEMTGHAANLTQQMTSLVNATRSTPGIVGRVFQFFGGRGGPGGQNGQSGPDDNRGGQTQPSNPDGNAPGGAPMMPTAAAS